MEEEKKDEKQNGGQAPAPTSGADSETDKKSEGASDSEKSPDGKSDEEIKIPKWRFDEEVAKRKDLEERFNQVSQSSSKTEQMMGQLRDVLVGKSASQVSDTVKQFAERNNMSIDVAADMMNTIKAEMTGQLEEQLKPFKTQQAQSAFERELNALEKTFPEFADMSNEDRKEFMQMAISKEYRLVPLTVVAKSYLYDKPTLRGKTLESSRGRSRQFEQEKSVADMSLEEFEAYSKAKEKETRK